MIKTSLGVLLNAEKDKLKQHDLNIRMEDAVNLSSIETMKHLHSLGANMSRVDSRELRKLVNRDTNSLIGTEFDGAADEVLNNPYLRESIQEKLFGEELWKDIKATLEADQT